MKKIFNFIKKSTPNLTQLANDADPGVRSRAAGHPNLTQALSYASQLNLKTQQDDFPGLGEHSDIELKDKEIQKLKERIELLENQHATGCTGERYRQMKLKLKRQYKRMKALEGLLMELDDKVIFTPRIKKKINKLLNERRTLNLED